MSALEKVLIFAAFFISAVFCQSYELMEVWTKTGSDRNAEMEGTVASVDFEFINRDFALCKMEGIRAGTNNENFKNNDTDTFRGAELGNCIHFSTPDKLLPRVTIYHHQLDAWQVEWVGVMFNDYTYVKCPDGAWIDNYEKHDLICEPKIYDIKSDPELFKKFSMQ